MWIFQNDAFLSVVAHRDKPDTLLVRSRKGADIERAIPGAHIYEDATADYRFRAEVSREDFAHALAKRARRIVYTNFKASVRERERHDIYMSVWSLLAKAFSAYGEGRKSKD